MKKKSQPDYVQRIRIITFWSGVTLIAVVLLTLFSSANAPRLLCDYLQHDANSFVFALFMAVLPLIGIPISIFLVLVGIIYGMAGGMILTGACILLHLITTYYLVHSLFRPLVIRILQRVHLGIPRLPRSGGKRLGFFFMIFPGLPYAMKNYLFALTETPFRSYLLISWPAQFCLSIPFIILGRGLMEMDVKILLAAATIILLGMLGQQYVRRRYNGG